MRIEKIIQLIKNDVRGHMIAGVKRLFFDRNTTVMEVAPRYTLSMHVREGWN